MTGAPGRSVRTTSHAIPTPTITLAVVTNTTSTTVLPRRVSVRPEPSTSAADAGPRSPARMTR